MKNKKEKIISKKEQYISKKRMIIKPKQYIKLNTLYKHFKIDYHCRNY
jgi:hypothetical protein